MIEGTYPIECLYLFIDNCDIIQVKFIVKQIIMAIPSISKLSGIKRKGGAEDAKGVSEVCTIVEEYAKEYAKEYAEEQVLKNVKAFIAAGVSNEQIKKATNLTDAEIDKLRSELS